MKLPPKIRTINKTLLISYTYLEEQPLPIPFSYHSQNEQCLSSFIKVSLDGQRISLILLQLNLPVFPVMLVFFTSYLRNPEGEKGILSTLASFLHLIFKSFKPCEVDF